MSYNVVNATKIVATFDLTDAPLGLYDVEVINPDGSTAIQPYRFLVEPAEPIDATIGMGGPSTLGIGQIGNYLVSLESITNVDTPYVFFEYGAAQRAEPGTVFDSGTGPGLCHRPVRAAQRVRRAVARSVFGGESERPIRGPGLRL